MANKNKSAKQVVVALVVKFESNVNGGSEKRTDRWNVDTSIIQATVNTGTEKLGENKLVNEESSCNGKDKDVSEVGTQEKPSH